MKNDSVIRPRNLISAYCLFVLIAVFNFQTAMAASRNDVRISDFVDGNTIIYVKVVSAKNVANAAIVRKSGVDIDKEELVFKPIDINLFEELISAKRGAHGPNVFKLMGIYDNEYEKIPEKKLQQAEENDLVWIKGLQQKLYDEHKRAGLKYNESEDDVATFYSGEATFQVLESFLGKLKVADEITVYWDNVPFTYSCPLIFPKAGSEQGMIFTSLVKNADRVRLGREFSSKLEASNTLLEFRINKLGAIP